MNKSSSSSLLVIGLKAEWIPIQSNISPSRLRHTSFTTATTTNSSSTTSFSFEGYIKEDNEGHMQSYLFGPYYYAPNDLWNWGNNSWREAKEVTGNIPSPILVSAPAVINDNNNNKAHLFGGWNPTTTHDNNTIFNTIHSLDLKSHK